MSAARPRVHIVYEYSIDYRPYSSSYLRLIRHFTHPRVTDHIDATFDLDFQHQTADLVILERLWRPDVTLPRVEQLVERIRRAGAKFIYALDDNFFDLVQENKGWPPLELLPIADFCLREADGVLLSTPALLERLSEFITKTEDRQQWVVVPNALDERLLVSRPIKSRSLEQRKVTIGAMGTATHDEDLLMILPAIETICRHHPGQVELQIVGVTRKPETQQALQGLPVRAINPQPEEQEYPLFMPWFTATLNWDIALSPLRDTPFNRTKSDVKFLDYAAIGAAGIFSRLPPYQSSVKHLETGWLAENTPAAWEEALETLISEPDLCQRIARRANRYLFEQRILAHRASDWVSAFRLY